MVSQDNLLGEERVDSEAGCQVLCGNTPQCLVYSWFLTGECLLLSSCSVHDLTCQCWTGPRECPVTTTVNPCHTPDSDENGAWLCHQEEEELTCYLQCEPGYAAPAGSKAVCRQGSWSRPVFDMKCLITVALVTGGSEWGPLQSVEIYSSNISQYLPDLPQDYRYHSCDFVEGEVLVCGGLSASGYCNYLTPDKDWSLHSNFTHPREGHSTSIITDSLLVMGGYFSSETSELFTPDIGNTWQPGQDLGYDHVHGCAVKIAPEVILMIGGEKSLNTVVEWNITSGVKTRRADLLQGRYWHSCVFFNIRESGFRGVLVAGGYTGGHNLEVDILAHTEILDLSTGIWRRVGDLNMKRDGLDLVVIEGGKILAMGGENGTTSLRSVELFQFETESWVYQRDLLMVRDWLSVTSVPLEIIKDYL